jgi:hypothetical protein
MGDHQVPIDGRVYIHLKDFHTQFSDLVICVEGALGAKLRPPAMGNDQRHGRVPVKEWMGWQWLRLENEGDEQCTDVEGEYEAEGKFCQA